MKRRSKFFLQFFCFLFSCISIFIFIDYSANQTKTCAVTIIRNKSKNNIRKLQEQNWQIIIPKLKIKNKIYKEASMKNLDRGVVQEYKKQVPGQKENYILAGHNLIYQKKFFTNLVHAKPNMLVFIKSNQIQYTYIIKKLCYTKTSDYKTIRPSNKNKKIILYTCTNSNNQKYRILVEGILIHEAKK